MRIGINFKDNDFCNTFRGFIKIFLAAVEWSDSLEENLTKENIARIINDMMPSICLLFQHRGPWERFRKVNLRINPQDIYLDEEIDEKLKTVNSWANHSFAYIDTDNGQSDIW